MINMLKADLYRVFRSKSFWVTQIILVVIVVFSVYYSSAMKFGVEITDRSVMDEVEAARNLWTGCYSIQALMGMGIILTYVMMPIFKIIVGNDLSKQAYKNIIPIGVSRKTYLFSKYIVFLFASFMQFVFYYLSGFLVGTIINGIGHFEAPASEVLWSFIISYFELQALYALMMLTLYLSFSNVAAILFGILYPAFLSIPAIIFPKATWLRYFSFGDLVTYIPVFSFSTLEWVQLIVPMLAAIIVGIVGSLLIFKKKEL